MRRGQSEMYIDHGHLCVCVSVCLSVRRHITTLLNAPRYNIIGQDCNANVYRLTVMLFGQLPVKFIKNLHRMRNVSEVLYSLY